VFQVIEIFKDYGIIKKIKVSKDFKYIGLMDNNRKIYIFDNMTKTLIKTI